MKFIHIADVHLGAVPDSNKPWGILREKEIWSSFQTIINICNSEKVDLLLIAGDLFHKQPLLRELKETNYLLSRLETAKAVIMAGNHDFIGPRSYYQDFIWDEKVHMFLADTIESVEYPELGVEVYGLSYRTRDITEPLYDVVKPGLQKQSNKINILLAHGGEEKNIPINKKALSEAGFDYVALGHIHKPEIINNKMAYVGSLEPLDKNEIGERGYILGEITQEQGVKKTSIRFISSSVREYKRVNLTVNQDTTNGSLQDQTREIMRTMGEQHIYLFVIQGIRDELMHFNKEGITELGKVLEVLDESVQDYDFDALYRENADNMIGLFIQKIRENPKQDEVARKALYYGIEALLGAKNK